MTKLKTKMIKILKCNKGEPLVESLVSLLVFAILMLAVSTMITTSLRITRNYNVKAGTQQVNANVGILEKAPPVLGEHIFAITGSGIGDVEVKVKLSQEGNLKTFYPEVSSD